MEKKTQTYNMLPFKQVAKVKAIPKRWKTAQMMPSGCVETHKNNGVESMYFQILQLAKELHLTLNEVKQKPVFEKDSKDDSSENALVMHSFITPCFYWCLECDFAYAYRIQYSFNNCPFKEQIMLAMSGWLDYLPNRIECRSLLPDHRSFYDKVIKVQDQEYIYLLTDNVKQSL